MLVRVSVASPRARQIWDLLRQTVAEWRADKASRLAAALAFYTVFSLTPTLIIVIALGSTIFGREVVRGEILSVIQSQVGEEGARVIQNLLAGAARRTSLATAVGLGTVLFGATIVFAELQDALNTIWGVTPKPRSAFRFHLRKRLLSFVIVLAIGFLLVLSLVASALLTAVDVWLESTLQITAYLLQGLNLVVSLAFTTVLFAVIYKVLPDAKIRWADVWVGSAVTSVLFTIGKLAISAYLAHSSVASAYGAAGSLVLLLVWVYYSAQIFLLGAEFTEVYAKKYGFYITPGKHAVRLVSDVSR